MGGKLPRHLSTLSHPKIPVPTRCVAIKKLDNTCRVRKRIGLNRTREKSQKKYVAKTPNRIDNSPDQKTLNSMPWKESTEKEANVSTHDARPQKRTPSERCLKLLKLA